MLSHTPLRWLLPLCYLLVLPALLTAQLQTDTPPRSASLTLPLPTGSVVMPPIDLSKIRAEDAIEDQYNQPLRFAWPFKIRLSLKDGEWTELADGSRLWRLRIDAPGASGMTLLYDDFYLPPGATLHLSGPRSGDAMGAFTSRNNTRTGRFATRVLDGDVTVLEYYEPAAVRGQGRIHIAQVGHAYRLMGIQKGLNDSGSCQVNINCGEGTDWQDEKRGVARIVVNGISLCTGGLLNNTRGDGRPYFLTADHCTGNLDAITNPDASNWVFYWDYERAGCANSGTVPNRTTSGATLVANNDASDVALFELTEDPNTVFNVYFNGWSRALNMARGGVGIHHPAGDAKKIATHRIIPNNRPGNIFLDVFWNLTTNGHSVTEGGSSGSPIFDASGRVLGQLFGGSAVNCSDPANDIGVYGRIYYSWDAEGTQTDPRRRLRDWLDPTGTNPTTVDGAYILPAPPTVGFALNQTLAAPGPISEENTTVPAGGGDCRPYTDLDLLLESTRPLNADYSGSVRIDGGTAVAGQDYDLLTTQFTLTAADPTTTVTVRIYDDGAIEPTENLRLVLRGPATAVASIGPDSLQSLEITSADGPVTPTRVGNYTFQNWSAGIPGDWTVVDGGTTTTSWNVVGSFGGNSLNGSDFIFFNSDAEGRNETHDEVLLSPVYDLAGVTDLRLSFQHYFRAYNLGAFETASVAVFDGAQWVEVYTLDQADGSVGDWGDPNVQDVDVTAYANDRFRVRFRYTAGYDWWWALDDIRLYGQQDVTVVSAVTTTPFEIYLGPNQTVPVRDAATSEVLATIENLSDHDYGCTAVSLTRDASGQAAYLFSSPLPNLAVLARALRIEPENNLPSGEFRIRFYLNAAEISTYEAVTGNVFSNLHMIKAAGVNIEDVNPANFSNQTINYRPLTTGMIGTFRWVEATFDSGFSSFTVGPNTGNASLPVNWLSFGGESAGKVNRLNWTVSDEINNDYFTVERSANGRDFGARARVQSVGLEAAPGRAVEYTFNDESPLAGDNFYRIRQTDYDGTSTFSRLIVLRNQGAALGGVLANPVRAGRLLVRTSDLVQQIQLLSADGKLLRRMAGGAADRVEIGVGELPAGVYILRLLGRGGESQVERVVIR